MGVANTEAISKMKSAVVGAGPTGVARAREAQGTGHAGEGEELPENAVLCWAGETSDRRPAQGSRGCCSPPRARLPANFCFSEI